MSVVIINATNLLGDSIYTLQPIKEYFDGVNEDRVILVSDRGLVNQMFHDTFPYARIYDDIDDAIMWAEAKFPGENLIQIRLDAGTSGHISFPNNWHISEGFAQMLGIKLKSPVLPYAPWKHWENNRDADKLPHIVGIAPFSRSCSRHSGEQPNKTLDDYKWITIIQFLRSHFDELVVVGGPKDRLQNVAVSEDEYFCASSFDDLRAGLKNLTMLVTVDNGIGHLASVLDVPTILLWPRVSSEAFIAPLWAPKTGYIKPIDPVTTPASVILGGLRPLTTDVLNNTGWMVNDALRQ